MFDVGYWILDTGSRELGELMIEDCRLKRKTERIGEGRAGG